MRVAVLGVKTLPAFAGADRVVEQVLEHGSGANEYTVYLARDRSRPRLASTDERRYVYVPALRGKHLRAPSYFLLSCLHYLVRGRYDVAHVHNSDFGLFCPLLRLRRGVRIVGTFHGDPYRRRKWGTFARAFLRASERSFARSCHVLTSVAPREADRVIVIPNGLAPPPDDVALPSELAGLGAGYVMFACGRLDATKGLHHLLRAYESLPEAPPLLVVGDFRHDRAYTAAIERAAARDARIVLHTQLLGRSELFAALRRASVFVFPSEFEAMSMMLLEAIASGTVVVCSDLPENLAIVGADYRFAFRSADPADLARVLENALVSPDRDPIASALRESVDGRFRWEAIAARYERVYESGA